jgi:hypothetical protein
MGHARMRRDDAVEVHSRFLRIPGDVEPRIPPRATVEEADRSMAVKGRMY